MKEVAFDYHHTAVGSKTYVEEFVLNMMPSVTSRLDQNAQMEDIGVGDSASSELVINFVECSANSQCAL